METKRSMVSNSKQNTELGNDNKNAIELNPHITFPNGNTPRRSKSISKGTTKMDVNKSPMARFITKILVTVSKLRPAQIVPIRTALKRTEMEIKTL